MIITYGHQYILKVQATDLNVRKFSIRHRRRGQNKLECLSLENIAG
jgi:hypothetical protein